MTPLVNEATVPHLAYFVDAVGELISPVLDIDRRLAQREIPAVDIGTARHGETPGRSSDCHAIAAFAARPQIEHSCPALPARAAAGMVRGSSIRGESFEVYSPAPLNGAP